MAGILFLPYIGAALMQKQGTGWKLIAYASRSMTETEWCYALIDKEALASTWACGRNFYIHPWIEIF